MTAFGILSFPILNLYEDNSRCILCHTGSRSDVFIPAQLKRKPQFHQVSWRVVSEAKSWGVKKNSGDIHILVTRLSPKLRANWRETLFPGHRSPEWMLPPVVEQE